MSDFCPPETVRGKQGTLGVFESGAPKNGALRNNVARIDPADILGKNFLEQNRERGGPASVGTATQTELRHEQARNELTPEISTPMPYLIH